MVVSGMTTSGSQSDRRQYHLNVPYVICSGRAFCVRQVGGGCGFLFNGVRVARPLACSTLELTGRKRCLCPFPTNGSCVQHRRATATVYLSTLKLRYSTRLKMPSGYRRREARGQLNAATTQRLPSEIAYPSQPWGHPSRVSRFPDSRVKQTTLSACPSFQGWALSSETCN